jgi:hypothetical protein
VARYAGLIGIKFAHDSLLEEAGFEPSVLLLEEGI